MDRCHPNVCSRVQSDEGRHVMRQLLALFLVARQGGSRLRWSFRWRARVYTFLTTNELDTEWAAAPAPCEPPARGPRPASDSLDRCVSAAFHAAVCTWFAEVHCGSEELGSILLRPHYLTGG